MLGVNLPQDLKCARGLVLLLDNQNKRYQYSIAPKGLATSEMFQHGNPSIETSPGTPFVGFNSTLTSTAGCGVHIPGEIPLSASAPGTADCS